MILSKTGNNGLRRSLGVLTGIVLTFLMLPLIYMVVLSLGNSRWMAFPPPGWTLQWYRQIFGNPEWLSSFVLSVEIGVYVVICSLLFAIPASFGLVRAKIPGKSAINVFILMPLFIPIIIVALALYILMLNMGLVGHKIAFVIAHTVVALPFSILMITNSLRSFDESIEMAAMICGASRLRAIFMVTIPSIRHGILAAALFAFLISWDEVVLSMFMAGPQSQTLPVRMWSVLRADLKPEIAAVSTIMLISTSLLVALAYFLTSKSRSVDTTA